MTRPYKPRGFKYMDPIEHEQHIAWLRAKSQEVFLGREWNLSIEDYMAVWGRDLWLLRGRKSNDLALTRIDWTRPWARDNVRILPRRLQIKISNQRHYERRQKNEKENSRTTR
jgi:hypothetical protein